MSRPRFSLLLPTCNRLSLLRQAVQSVRDQAFRDFEIVISDNASEEDIASLVRELDDPRIVYSRSEQRIDVTSNWNRALDLSSGELVLMLGDDDGLARGYLSRLDRLVRETDADAVYTGAFKLTYPGVGAHAPNGELLPYGYAGFMQHGAQTRSLPYEERRGHVATMLKGRVSFGFNMQFLLVTRRLIDRLRPLGAFYQSLFPDYYAMAACFLTADRLVSFRQNCVFIGVSPKSYGFYHQRQREKEGAVFLHAGREREPQRRSLPGSHLITGWQDAAEHIVDKLGRAHGLSLDPWRYRLLQIAHNSGLLHGNDSGQIAADFVPQLNITERALWRVLSAPVIGPRVTRRFQHLMRLTPFTWNPAPVMTSVASLDQARADPATFVE